MRTPEHLVAVCAFFIGSAPAGFAGQFGQFTYVEHSTTIEITKFQGDAPGDFTIPSEIA
jgi:hypothetical protein